MRTFDAIVAAVFLASTFGILIFKTVRAWQRFHVQERAARLLVDGVNLLEAREEPTPTKRDESR